MSIHVPDASGWFEYEITCMLISRDILDSSACSGIYRADKDKCRDEGYYNLQML